MNSFPSAKLVDVGVDWLTLTTRDSSRAAMWREIFADAAQSEQRKGHKWSEIRQFGYEGQQCGHVMYGKRADGAMVRLTSSFAHDWGMLFEPDGAHCTRIDVQATAELAYARPDFLKRVYQAAVLHKTSNGRPPVASITENSAGGCTVTLGSRTSMRYFRLYDKGVEQGTDIPGKVLRWELEIKDTLADQAVGMLVGSADVQRSILGVVGSFCTDRGVPVLWTVPPLEQKFDIPRVTQEDAGGLRWLSGPVASTVARLMETVGPEETLRALLAKWRASSSDVDVLDLLADVLGN